MFSKLTVVITMRRNLHLSSLILIAAAAAAISGCAARASQQHASQTLAVAVERPRPPQAAALYEGPGSVSPAHTYQLSFQIPGRIARVNYDVGDRVPAGAVLASLDSSDYAAQAAAATAQALSAPNAARAQLERAQAATALAHVNYVRAVNLYNSGAISAQQRDSALAAERDAQAQVNAAQAQITESAAPVANARFAQITLGKTALTSPADAIVQKRSIEPGDTASPGVRAFTLISSGVPDVLVSVPERVRGQIHVGTSAIVQAGARSYSGIVARLEPAADELSRTAQVRVHVPNLPLPAGTVVTVRLGVTHRIGFSVPLGALMSDADGRTSVELYDSATSTLASRPVRVVADERDRVIVNGLTSADLVVTQGQYEAKPGDRVHIVQRATQ